MIRYKIDILYALKCRGFNSTFLRQNKILSESAMSSLRHNNPVSFVTLDRICALLGRDVSELIEFIPDEKVVQKKNEAYKKTAESMARGKGVSIAVFKRPKELHVLKGNEVLFQPRLTAGICTGGRRISFLRLSLILGLRMGKIGLTSSRKGCKIIHI